MSPDCWCEGQRYYQDKEEQLLPVLLNWHCQAFRQVGMEKASHV